MNRNVAVHWVVQSLASARALRVGTCVRAGAAKTTHQMLYLLCPGQRSVWPWGAVARWPLHFSYAARSRHHQPAGGGGGAPKEGGGGGVGEMGFRAGPFVLCKKGCWRCNTNFGPKKFFPPKISPHKCVVKNHQRDLGIILSRGYWGQPPSLDTAGGGHPPPPPHPEPPLPARQTRGGRGLGNGPPCPPTPPPPRSIFLLVFSVRCRRIIFCFLFSGPLPPPSPPPDGRG